MNIALGTSSIAAALVGISFLGARREAAARDDGSLAQLASQARVHRTGQLLLALLIGGATACVFGLSGFLLGSPWVVGVALASSFIVLLGCVWLGVWIVVRH